MEPNMCIPAKAASPIPGCLIQTDPLPHPDAAVTSLIPWLSCRSCRPHAPFAELVRLSRASIVDEMREEHRRRVLGE
jgi:hypothetical protein